MNGHVWALAVVFALVALTAMVWWLWTILERSVG